jgi:hypothetical protein
VIDTRTLEGPLGGPPLVAGVDRSFPVAGSCGIPPTAQALAVNIAAVGSSTTGNLRLHPGGTPVPLVSSINYSAGQTRSSNAIAQLNGAGELAVFSGQALGTVNVVVDVSGYLQ